MTPETAGQRLLYWCKRLHLDEYADNISVEFVGPKRMGKITGDPEALGSARWHAEECTAQIFLRRCAGEDTLLHEILHIVLEGHTTYVSEKYSELHERAINRIAAALLTDDAARTEANE